MRLRTAYRARFEAASAAYDSLLWNGQYYGQPVTGADFDFGDGCLSDQLIGQWWAHQLDLGHLLPVDHVRTALASIVRYNLRHGFRDFVNQYRVYADGDDSGLLVCTWPRGGRPAVPVRYADEVWSGTEYQVAAHCLYEGLDAEARAILTAVRGRMTGERRNPFNEIECGDHYSRAMSAWSLLGAATGFRHDALTSALRVSAAVGRYPFLTGSAWGVLVSDGAVARLSVLHGELRVDQVTVGDAGSSWVARTRCGSHGGPDTRGATGCRRVRRSVPAWTPDSPRSGAGDAFALSDAGGNSFQTLLMSLSASLLFG